MFYQFLPATSVGNEYGQQMTIQILILGLKGLSIRQDYSHLIMLVKKLGDVMRPGLH